MKVALFGAFDPAYPRTVVIRQALESAGVEVCAVHAPPRAGAFSRAARLLAGWLSGSRGVNAVVVPSFGHRDVPLATLLARLSGVPVLFDPLVSRWDTQVGDLERVRSRGIGAWRLRQNDRLSLSIPDLVLCDTWEHGDFFASEFGVPKRKLARIPVGADRLAFERGDARARAAAVAGAGASRSAGGPLEVIYVGGFLPLHGVDTVVEAATLLERRGVGPRSVRLTLVGGGMTAHRAERDIAARGLRSVRRIERVSYPRAIDLLAGADVALGIFGTTPKAGRVVPHKVWQSLALGVPVVTRRSRASAEFFRSGEHLVEVPPGDPAALADAIERLARDPEARARIGASGREAARAQGSPERIAPLLLDAVQRAWSATAPKGKR
ncbi:MAG TPA: glycosyltransferase [Candidatus Eisenbacteria bacterium]|nr:glycosyltransferase [Candidatus Eisenbacteria bacterium]